jgi:hypothetical protein
VIAGALLVLGASCNQSNTVDLTAVQKMVAATDSAAPTYAAISGDFFGSCKRARIWELTGKWLPNTSFTAPTLGSLGQLSPSEAAKLPKPLLAEYQKEVAAYTKAMKDYNAKVAGWNALQKSVASKTTKAENSPQPTYQPPTPAASTPSSAGKPAATTTSIETPPPFGGADVCAEAAYSSQQWQKLNVALISYVDALGHLAAVGSGTASTYGFDTLGNSLTASKLMSASQVSAVQSALTEVSNNIFAAKSREQIAKYAPQAQQDVGVIIDTLERIADVDYRGLLDIERLDIDQFYQDNLLVTSPGLQSLETLPYRQQWVGDISALDAKVAAINAYRTSLEALRTAHEKLVKESVSHDVDLTSAATAFVAEYLPSLEAIDKAFATPAKSPAAPTPKPKGA